MLRMQNSTEHSDVSFLVDGHTFHVHKVVLACRALGLLELADTSSAGPIEIPGVPRRYSKLLLTLSTRLKSLRNMLIWRLLLLFWRLLINSSVLT